MLKSKDVTPIVKAAGAAEVKVNGAAAGRRERFFWKELQAANGNGPALLEVAIDARLAGAGPHGQTVCGGASGARLVPPANQGFEYDDDGNLTADDLWTYDWDAENRLRSVTSAESLPEADRVRLEFDYDSQWRRIQKTVKHRQSGNWVETSRSKFIWNDWHLMAELDANNGDAAIRSYLWGPDISGTFGGAGGIGGLLLVRDHASGEVYAPLYDGNGNILGLGAMDGSGQLLARYEYGPFGEPLRATGPAADRCPFRFSSKYTDEETGMVYYGYRHYSPLVGRWISRDPMEEFDGFDWLSKNTIDEVDSRNLQVFVSNATVNSIDAQGLWRILLVKPWLPKNRKYFWERYNTVVREFDKYKDRARDLLDRAKAITVNCCYRDAAIKDLED